MEHIKSHEKEDGPKIEKKDSYEFSPDRYNVNTYSAVQVPSSYEASPNSLQAKKDDLKVGSGEYLVTPQQE